MGYPLTPPTFFSNPIKLQDYITEWMVEDSERYNRVSIMRVQQQDRLSVRLDKVEKVDNALVAVLLEIPRRDAERVIMQIRQAPQARDPVYLRTLAEAADGGVASRQRELAREAYVAHLEKALTAMARRLDETEDAIDRNDLWGQVGRMPPRDVGARHQNIVRAEMQDKRGEARAELDRIRLAINERKASVAAELLSKIPDFDDEG